MKLAADSRPGRDKDARIEACVKARGDSGFVIIARCDELNAQSRGGGGGGSLEEAIKRGLAYAEAGADALFFAPATSPEATAELVEAMPIPVCVLGFPVPGTAFCLSTGWGWMGAAEVHYARAKELMETGKVAMGPDVPDKSALIEQDLYDALIGDWAKKIGRPTR